MSRSAILSQALSRTTMWTIHQAPLRKIEKFHYITLSLVFQDYQKDNKQWVWLAIDADSKEIVGLYIGDRSRESAEGLWNSLPAVYRQCAVSYTDFWEAYEAIFPTTRHRPVGKETGKTSHIERFNCT